MGLFRSLSGTIGLELVSADVASALRAIQHSGVELREVQQKDPLTLAFLVRRDDLTKLRRIAQRRGDTLRRTGKNGLFWALKNLQRRPVLVLGIGIILLLSLILPSRVLFVRVEGNHDVPRRMILEEAAKCGIILGASTRQVRSEHVKNRLLSQIDKLQWAGVNTYGCVAVISVKERATEPEQNAGPEISSIVARRDGIIISMVAEQGSPLCKPGDAVTAGQKLISGYTDHGIAVTATQAKGEILALTGHSITVHSPTQYRFRAEAEQSIKKYALLIGKNRINFYKGSGILDTTCARIYSQWYMTLPGGFVLPIGLVCEEYITFAQEDRTLEEMDLTTVARRYVLRQTVAGEILSAVETTETKDGILILHGSYACRENLGITRIEENFEEYGKDP